MNNYLLKKIIKETQIEYLDLLKKMMPMLYDEKYVVVALDEISLFWRKKKTVIDMYLQYIVKERNTVFYTAATYFDVKNGEQYPFLLMGDEHIFDDPLGRYCEICHNFGDAPKVLSEKVSVCAKDNIDIIEKCEGLILVLPLRFMGNKMDEEEFLKIGEKAFLDFFNGIPDLNTYFSVCNTIDDVIRYFKDEYKDAVYLYEGDNVRIEFRTRIESAIKKIKTNMGEGYSQGQYFYFSIFGPLQQAIDILFVASAYNAVPLIRYSVALHNVFLLLPVFFGDDNDDIKAKIYVLNSLYKMFDQELYVDKSLSEFYERVKKFSFEDKALSCFKADNLKRTLEELHLLVEDFESRKNN